MFEKEEKFFLEYGGVKQKTVVAMNLLTNLIAPTSKMLLLLNFFVGQMFGIFIVILQEKFNGKERTIDPKIFAIIKFDWRK